MVDAPKRTGIGTQFAVAGGLYDKWNGRDFAGTGFLVGGFVGDVVSGGIESFASAAARSRSLSYRLLATAPGLVGAGAGYAYGYQQGGIDKALLYGSIRQGIGGALGSRLVKCFVAGTPVWTPALDEPATQVTADLELPAYPMCASSVSDGGSGGF